jgi:class 3 adenylate cyclase
MSSELRLDVEALGLTEIIQLREQLSQVLTRRFDRALALAFTDIVGSTAYFARFGNEAGRTLQQRHYDLLQEAVLENDGRIVDTAGDGAFTCFPTVDAAVETLVALQKLVVAGNADRPEEQHLTLRIGVHFGHVLTDGKLVTGDPVNLASRITSTCEAGEIRLSNAAFQELSNSRRVECRSVGAVELKGIPAPVELMVLSWQHPEAFPTMILVDETGASFQLPEKDTIAFGRLREHDGRPANDIVLDPKDPEQAMLISRWQFVLHRRFDGMKLRSVSEQVTEVDGQAVPKGQEVPIGPKSVVRVARIMTLRFVDAARPGSGRPGRPQAETTIFK